MSTGGIGSGGKNFALKTVEKNLATHKPGMPTEVGKNPYRRSSTAVPDSSRTIPPKIPGGSVVRGTKRPVKATSDLPTKLKERLEKRWWLNKL